MFYMPEMFSMRKKGKLARCWLAAILSEKVFKKTISKKVILSIDISETCDKILRIITTVRENGSIRCSLYLSSQLMYGATKLLRYQTFWFNDELCRIYKTLEPVDLIPNKKRRNESLKSNVTDIFDLPDPPSFSRTFANLESKIDLNLISQEDIIHDNNHLDEPSMDWTNFGELTAEEMDMILLTEDLNILEMNEQYGNAFDFPNDSIRAVDNPVHSLRSRLETPKKRGATVTEVDTPTKKQRRSLEPELDATVRHEILDAPKPDDLTEIPMDIAMDQIPEIPMDQPIEISNVVLPEPAITPPHQTTIPSDLHLDSLEQENPRPRRIRRRRSIQRIDRQTVISTEEVRRSIANVDGHTIDKATSRAVTEFRVGIPVSVLFKTPASHFSSFSKRNRQLKMYKWNTALAFNFERQTWGKCHDETDRSLNAEVIRVMDSRIQEEETISLHLPKSTFHEKPANKTTDEALQIIPPEPEIPEVITEIEFEPINVDLPDVLQETTENISEAPTVTISKQTDFTVSNIISVPGIINGKSTLNTESGDIDEFLPSNLKSKNIIKSTKQAKSSSSENIIDVKSTPCSIRSRLSSQPEWSISDLLSQLEVRWRDNAAVEFTDLVPQETSSTFDAASCFSLLLELQQQKKAVLIQTGCFKPTFIARYEKN